MVGVEKIYNVAAIGFGGMAHNHYKQSLVLDRIHLKGVFDINPERMEFAKSLGMVAYESREALINDPEVDIVLVAVPNHLHRPFAIEALRAGKAVLCEKPVTIESWELEEVMQVAKETGNVFTVDQNRRVNKDFVAMRRAVEAGLLGDVYVIESRVEGSRGVPAGWRIKKEEGGGMMLDWGVHLIDQIMYMYDAKVTNVFCKMYSVNYPEVDDNFRLTMTLDNGVTAHIEVSTNNFVKHPRWYVLGTEGTLVIDDWDCEGKVVRCKDRQDTWDANIPTSKAGPSKTMAPRSEDTLDITPITAPTDVDDNLNPTYWQLVDKLDGKAELTITAEQALRVVKVMEAAFKSAETGEAIKTDI